LRQLKNPLIYVLLTAAVAALLLGDFSVAGFIGVVLALNSAVGGCDPVSAAVVCARHPVRGNRRGSVVAV